MARAGENHWNRRSLTIPPDSWRAWFELVAWQFWMGILLCGLLTFGVLLVVTAPDRIVVGEDLSACYATTVVLPCERTVYRTGGLNAAFSVLWGVMLLAAAAWLISELWSTVEPKPITDDFLKLLNDSFARNWRDPRTWPWSRLFWAYGFTAVGLVLTAVISTWLWTVVPPKPASAVPYVTVTSERFKVSP
jgi:hypothetical protein